jgi:hypothetical protein
LSSSDWHRVLNGARDSIRRGALPVALVMLSCCGTANLPGQELPQQASPELGNQAAYDALAASYLAKQLKDIPSYDSFEISGPRWVHAVVGWSLLACVHFRDHGHRRTYALFIQGNEVVDARYAVETDSCALQIYAPFGLPTSASGYGTAAGLAPLH